MRNKILSFRVTAFFCLLCIALLGTVSPAFAQEGKKITGHVVDDTNEPLIGASILVVGTSTGVITDLMETSTSLFLRELPPYKYLM